MEEDYSNIKVIHILKKGNDKEIESLYRYLYKETFPYITKLVLSEKGEKSDAQDIYTESFMILYKNVRNDSFAGDSSFKTYLIGIAKRLWLREKSKRNSIYLQRC